MKLIVTVLTPFDARGRVDLPALRAHTLKLASKGVDGFLPAALEGEALYLSAREREEIHRTVLDAALGKPVYPCVWDPRPSTAAYLAESAKEMGAKAVVASPPFGYDLHVNAILHWYRNLKLAEVPVYAIHRPNRAEISEPVYRELRQHEMIDGIIDFSGDPFRIRRIIGQHVKNVFVGGDRLLNQGQKLNGAVGQVSLLANAYPEFCQRLLRENSTHLAEALSERRSAVVKAGGLVALKSLLRLGTRAPLLAPPDEALEALTPPE